MISLNSWPYDRPAEERQLLDDALGRCETSGQAQAVLSAFLAGDILADILMTPPVWREHWWQFWRMRRPDMLDG